MIITIDGPAGTGKSTVARMLAQKIGFIFFDTGAMYRAVTYKLLKENIGLQQNEEIAHLLKNFPFRIESINNEKRYFLEEEDISSQIRSQEVTRNVSEVSALPIVREALVDLQRQFAMGVNAVFEGRDMGSTVFVNAGFKVFLSATPEVRAERRFREFVFKHPSEAENLTRQQVLEDLLRRDAFDSSREYSPLRPADDAYLIDTSDLTIDEVVEKILELFLQKHSQHET